MSEWISSVCAERRPGAEGSSSPTLPLCSQQHTRRQHRRGQRCGSETLPSSSSKAPRSASEQLEEKCCAKLASVEHSARD